MFRFLYKTIFRESPLPTKVTCYLILLLRYAGSMSYFLCDGAGYHITCIPCVGLLCLPVHKLVKISEVYE